MLGSALGLADHRLRVHRCLRGDAELADLRVRYTGHAAPLHPGGAIGFIGLHAGQG